MISLQAEEEQEMRGRGCCANTSLKNNNNPLLTHPVNKVVKLTTT
jgi:hypothetical protein